jgi:quercetin dioxygenase-like cupin family protein
MQLSAAENFQLDSAKPVTREAICALQESIIPFACEQPEPIHRFAPGMYMRELTIPAGMLVVGKIHKHEHFLLVMSGRADVVSEFGRDTVTAGHISISPAGVKRAVLALEDTRFVTLHHNPEDIEDLEIIEAQHIEPEVCLLKLASEMKARKELL